MFRNKFTPILLSAVLALAVLAGCTGTMNGGGQVDLLDVETGLGTGTPTTAAVAVAANCNDHKDSFRATLHLTDNTNGANFTALLPWTSVSDLTGGQFTTCEDAAAFVQENGFSGAGGLINDQGQESGEAGIVVSAPGVGLPEVGNPCGDLQTIVLQAEGTDNVLPGGGYQAIGCLAKGQIIFQ